MFTRTKQTDWLAKVADLSNLHAAWRAVRRNKGQEGLDGVTLAAFQANSETTLVRMQRELREHSYQPSALKRVMLAKRGHGRRSIAIPTVADRVVQHAILRVLVPHFEPRFSPCSYGFRPGRSAHQAVQAVMHGLVEGYTWIVEADLQDCFDTLDWGILRHTLAAEIQDPPLLELIHRFLQAGALQEQRTAPPPQGVPQGAGFSPLLANIYLTPFDRLMSGRGYRLVRYADDLLTLHRTPDEAKHALRLMQETLRDQLKLRLNPEKTGIKDARRQPFDFLSFRFSQGAASPAPEAVQRFQSRVQALIRTSGAQGATALAEQLNPLIRGWGEYFKIGQVAGLYRQLDAWIARQLAGGSGSVGDLTSLTALYLRRHS